MNDVELKYERFFDDPLFCSFVDCLDKAGHGTSFGAVKIWSEALEVLRRLSSSKRPDLLIEGIFSDLCISSGSEKEAGTILICVLYMICSRDQIDNKMSIVARKIASKVVDHPMLIEVFAKQREAERMEEASGNPVPSDYCLTNGKALLEDPAAPYGGIISMLDEDLLTCIADKDRFDEFVKIINGEIASFILSPEGTSQLWEVVRHVSIEEGFIVKRCARNKFARIIENVCPRAGKAQQIDQNMQKFDMKNSSNNNDITSNTYLFINYSLSLFSNEKQTPLQSSTSSL